jgi:hypothetical protein
MKTLNKTYALVIDGTSYDNVTIELHQYADSSSWALVLMGSPDGYPEQLITPTANVTPAYGWVPTEGGAFIKNYAEYKGLTAELESLGVVKRTGEVRYGQWDVEFLEVVLVGEWLELLQADER